MTSPNDTRHDINAISDIVFDLMSAFKKLTINCIPVIFHTFSVHNPSISGVMTWSWKLFGFRHGIKIPYQWFWAIPYRAASVFWVSIENVSVCRHSTKNQLFWELLELRLSSDRQLSLGGWEKINLEFLPKICY